MTLYAYGFTFHYGDGLSNYSGNFYSTSADFQFNTPIKDNFDRFGYYTISLPQEVSPIPGDKFGRLYFHVEFANGGQANIAMNPGSANFSSNNIYMTHLAPVFSLAGYQSSAGIHSSISPIGPHASTVYDSDTGQTYTIFGPEGTAGLGSEGALTNIAGSSASIFCKDVPGRADI